MGTGTYCVPPRLFWYGQEQLWRMTTDPEGVAEFIFGHHEASQGDRTEEQSFEYAVRILMAPKTPVEQRVALVDADSVEIFDRSRLRCWARPIVTLARRSPLSGRRRSIAEDWAA